LSYTASLWHSNTAKEKCYPSAQMPWDCDKYFAFDREKDSDLWPISPVRHLPVVVLAFAVCCAIALLVLLD